eukprot:CAMPEP_0116902064 /NCGR_PEP_ID=MMETSP0467-20121206/9766_1 /TAXON_ID=283647 /ORGANISM="Mesodinium pulex, Strain SPMC105" /LENGTH=69 /DNA_ID=CAMNT_0004575777 /DNA_START=691 /DNA_END=900 /DNA_ORIENTATION=-
MLYNDLKRWLSLKVYSVFDENNVETKDIKITIEDIKIFIEKNEEYDINKLTDINAVRNDKDESLFDDLQ